MAIMAVHPYYMARSLRQEPAEVYKQLIDAMEKAGQQNTHLYWLARTSYVQVKGINYEDAFQVYKQAHDFFVSQNDPIRVAHSLNNMSYARMNQGQMQGL